MTIYELSPSLIPEMEPSSELDLLDMNVDLESDEYRKFDFDIVEDTEAIGNYQHIIRAILTGFAALENSSELVVPGFLHQELLDNVDNMLPEFGFHCVRKKIGGQKYVLVRKRPREFDLIGNISLSKPSELVARTLLDKYPFVREEVLQPKSRKAHASEISDFAASSENPEDSDRYAIGKLTVGPCPGVPVRPSTNFFLKLQRENLPIWRYRDEILRAIQGNQIVLIKGDAGCGKTTQIPQFLLEDAYQNNKRVRIISCLPRKVAVIAISERVATERGEVVGNTVGYQVKLESRVSPCNTLLTYCTTGVLLRSIANFDYAIFKNTTHLIVDEAHVRDRFTDFILACLKDILRHFPRLQLIIIGADDHLEKIASYLGIDNCCQLDISGYSFEVKTKFLDDVLLYTTAKVNDPNLAGCILLAKSLEFHNGVLRYESLSQNHTCEVSDDYTFLPTKERTVGTTSADELIAKAFTTVVKKPFDDFINLVLSSEISVNYQSTETGVTMLMAAAAAGSLDLVKQFYKLGANPHLVANNGYTAIEFSRHFHHQTVFDFLNSLEQDFDNNLTSMDPRTLLLSRYIREIDEELNFVDLELTLRLIHRIHITHAYNQAILVFLPGYEEIVALKQMLFNNSQYQFKDHSLVLYMVHSNMENGDQRAMFAPPKNGIRKIILATNIAENSLTFDDVVHVIDSGKEREKTIDAATSVGFSRFKYSWISKSSALQRRSRVGRCQPGYHFCLYSAQQFEEMDALSQPEVLWCSLQELCLQCRELICPEVKIEDFFSRLPETPPGDVVNRAIRVLTSLGALDDDEELTTLGSHLADLFIEPRLGKALLYSVVLKCLDPVLTIVSALAYRDPFEIPDGLNERKKSLDSKRTFARDTFSDHVAILKAFQEWEKLKSSGTEPADDSCLLFCLDNHISAATFEMIYGIRTQLLAQLRASGFVRCKGSCDVRDLNRYSENLAIVKAALLAGLYPNISKIERRTMTVSNGVDHNVQLHPSSSLMEPNRLGISSVPSDWIMCDEIINFEDFSYIRGCTAISAIALALFGGSELVPDVQLLHCGHHALATYGPGQDEQRAILRLHGWIALLGTSHEIQLILQIRAKFLCLFERQMRKPGAFFSRFEETLLTTLLLILTSEDQKLGLLQTDGIGQWPKFAGGNLLSAPRLGFEKTESADSDGEESYGFFQDFWNF